MKQLNLVIIFLLIVAAGNAQKIMGFTDTNAANQVSWEKQFDAQLKTQNMDSWMQFLTSHPHHVGSPQDKVNAEYIADLFKQWGYNTGIESYYVLFPTPKTRLLELTGSKPFKAKLEEPALKEDRTSGQKNEQLPTYNAYSADGDVTAELIFVNHGIPADYEELERLGIDDNHFGWGIACVGLQKWDEQFGLNFIWRVSPTCYKEQYYDIITQIKTR